MRGFFFDVTPRAGFGDRNDAPAQQPSDCHLRWRRSLAGRDAAQSGAWEQTALLDRAAGHHGQSLWTGDAEHYRHLIDEQCVMVVPTPPFVLQGSDAIEAVADTPRWDAVDFSDGHIVRPQEGLIVVAYRANAKRDGGNGYEAHCTSTYRRLGHDEWRVVQHQQTPPLKATVEAC